MNRAALRPAAQAAYDDLLAEALKAYGTDPRIPVRAPYSETQDDRTMPAYQAAEDWMQPCDHVEMHRLIAAISKVTADTPPADLMAIVKRSNDWIAARFARHAEWYAGDLAYQLEEASK